jgi:HSP20 family protein
MGLEGWLDRSDPFQEWSKIREDMNRLFEGAFQAPLAAYPPVNVWASEEEAVVTAELPGLAPADVRLSFENDELVLEGERKEYRPKEGDQVHRQERVFGPFKRAVALPFRIDPSKAEARVKNGLLTVRLPRHEAEKPRKINVTLES